MFKRFVLAAAALAISVVSANATVFLARINTTGQVVGTPITPLQLIPGQVIAPFVVPSGGTYIVTFSAECAVDGIGRYLSLDIVIDGISRVPTAGTNDAFCSSDHTPARDNYGFRSLSIPVSLSAGNHTLQIRTSLPIGGAPGASLDDFATIIHN